MSNGCQGPPLWFQNTVKLNKAREKKHKCRHDSSSHSCQQSIFRISQGYSNNAFQCLLCSLAGREAGSSWVGSDWVGLKADKVLRDACADSHNQLSEKCVSPPRPDVMTIQIQRQRRTKLPVWLSLAKQTQWSVVQVTPGDRFSQILSLTQPPTVINPLW